MAGRRGSSQRRPPQPWRTRSSDRGILPAPSDDLRRDRSSEPGQFRADRSNAARAARTRSSFLSCPRSVGWRQPRLRLPLQLLGGRGVARRLCRGNARCDRARARRCTDVVAPGDSGRGGGCCIARRFARSWPGRGHRRAGVLLDPVRRLDLVLAARPYPCCRAAFPLAHSRGPRLDAPAPVGNCTRGRTARDRCPRWRPLRDARALTRFPQVKPRPRRRGAPRARRNDRNRAAPLLVDAGVDCRGRLVDPRSFRCRAGWSIPGRAGMAAARPPPGGGPSSSSWPSDCGRRSDRPGRRTRGGRGHAGSSSGPALLLCARLEGRLVLPVRPAVLFALPPDRVRALEGSAARSRRRSRSRTTGERPLSRLRFRGRRGRRPSGEWSTPGVRLRAARVPASIRLRRPLVLAACGRTAAGGNSHGSRRSRWPLNGGRAAFDVLAPVAFLPPGERNLGIAVHDPRTDELLRVCSKC